MKPQQQEHKVDLRRLRLALGRRAAREQALGLEQTETLPGLSEAGALDIKRRTVRQPESL